jgi:hypothetical protein
MAKPRIKSVGRVGVGVTPLTGDFKAQLLAYLKKLENETSLNIDLNIDTARLKAELDSFQQRYEMKIGAILDEDSLTGDVRDKIKTAQAYADRNKLKINTDIVDDNWRKRMLDKTFQDAKEVDLALGISKLDNKARRELQVAVNELRDHLSLEMPISLDGEVAYKEEAERLQKKFKDLRLKLDVDVSVSDKAWFEQIEKELNDRTVTLTPHLKTEAARVKLNALHTEIKDKLSELVRVGVTTEQARTEMRNLLNEFNGRNIGISVNPNVLAASARLREFMNRPRTLTLFVNANTKKAAAKIGALAASLTGIGAANAALGKMTNLLMNIGTIGPRVGATSSIVGGIGAAAISSISGLASLIGSMEKLLGVAGLIPAALTGIVAVSGTLLASFHGIGKAIAAINDNNIGGGGIRKNALAQATQEASAQRAIEAAYRNAERAAEDSKQRILDTQTAVKNARTEATQSQTRDYRAVRDALKAYDKASTKSSEIENQVTKAREKAVQTVIDLQRAVANATLDRKQAEIEYKKALQAFMSGSTDTSESKDAVYELEVALEAARQKVSDTKADEKKLKSERDAATKAGVEGADEVVAAKEAQSDATNDLIAAEENLAYARSEQAANVEKNQGAIANAVRDASRAERDAVDARLNGIEAITKAEEAAYNLSVQRTDTQSRMEDALKGLTAEGKKAAYAFLSVRDKMGAVRDIAQTNFFAGFTDPMVNMVDNLLPQLRTGVGAIAKTLGEGFGTFFNSATAKLKNGDLDTILQNFSKALEHMNRSIEPLVGAFVDLTAVGSEVLIPLSDGFAKWAQEFKEFIAVARADGSLKSWMEAGIQGVKELANVFKGAYRIVMAIDEAAKRVGGLTMLSLGENLNKAADKMLGKEFQDTMVYVMRGAQAALDGLGEGIKAVGNVFKDNGPAIQVMMGSLGENLGKIITLMAKVFGDPKFIAGFQRFLDSFGKGLGELIDNAPLFAEIFANVAEVAGKIFELVVPIIVSMAKQLAPFMQTLKDGLPPILEGMKPLAPVISAVVLALAGLGGLGAVAGTVSGLVTSLGGLFGLFGVGGAAAAAGGGGAAAGGGLFAGLGAALLPLLPLIAAVAAAVGLVVVAFNNWDDVMSNFAAAGMFFDDFWSKFNSNADAGKFAIGEFFGGIGGMFEDFGSGLSGMTTDLNAWGDSLRDGFWGMIRDFGGMFADFGKNIIDSMVKGLWENAPGLMNAIDGILKNFGLYLPHSPAKKGPLSGKGYTSHSGKAMVVDMARAMTDATPYVENAALSVMTAANLSNAAAPFNYSMDAKYSQDNASVGGASVVITNNVYEAVSAQATAIEINRKQLAGAP